MAQDTDVKEVLAAIKKTATLKDKIRKELGLDKEEGAVIQLEDMYSFEYKHPEREHRSWITLHGKCIEVGQRPLLEMGYMFITVGHYRKDDKTKAGVRCKHCGKLMDKKERERFVKERDKKLDKAHADWLEEKAIREEWEAEQILLGKM